MAQLQKRTFWQLAWQGIQDGGPGMCQFALTSLCNATCSFCNFAVDKMPREQRQSVTVADAKAASQILYDQGIYFMIYVGGEPLAHPQFTQILADATDIGMAPMLVTNGALLTPKRVDQLAEAGLLSAIISIDAADAQRHEDNRGLRGVCDRIRLANERLAHHNIGTTASVTMSRLVDDYSQLPQFLRSLGFESVTFSYPLTTLTSSYLGFSDSDLVDYTPAELQERFEAIKALKQEFHVVNPTASIEDMQRHLRGEPERFGCLAGWKFFYLDWELNLYRCNNWDRPLCHVSEFDGSQRIRDGCTACMVDCYRDSSVMQHIGVSVSDGVHAAAKGQLTQAMKHWFNQSNLISLQSVIEESSWLPQLW